MGEGHVLTSVEKTKETSYRHLKKFHQSSHYTTTSFIKDVTVFPN